MMILSPSLLAADLGRLAAELADLDNAGLKWVHWDVMDGLFVPNITFGQHLIQQMRPACRLFFDVHLMIQQPERYLEAFHDAGADMLTIHAEATLHLQRTLAEIRRLGMQAGVALNPATPICTIENILDDCDLVLLMSVNPGFGGQQFLQCTWKKLRTLRAMLEKRKTYIEIDGGVTPENTPELVCNGADVLVSGSSFFSKKDYAARKMDFEKAAERAYSLTI